MPTKTVLWKIPWRMSVNCAEKIFHVLRDFTQRKGNARNVCVLNRESSIPSWKFATLKVNATAMFITKVISVANARTRRCPLKTVTLVSVRMDSTEKKERAAGIATAEERARRELFVIKSRVSVLVGRAIEEEPVRNARLDTIKTTGVTAISATAPHVWLSLAINAIRMVTVNVKIMLKANYVTDVKQITTEKTTFAQLATVIPQGLRANNAIVQAVSARKDSLAQKISISATRVTGVKHMVLRPTASSASAMMWAP